MNQHHHEVTRGHRLVGNAALLAVVLALLLNVVFYVWARPPGVMRNLGVIVNVREALLQGYVKQPDDKKLVEAAINGMVQSLGDQHTRYFNADELALFNEHVTGEYSGIGAEVDIHNDRLRIIVPFEGSPAWQAGVLPGDIVMTINGNDTLGIPIEQTIMQLKGTPDTQVNLEVRHADGNTESLTVTRGVIRVDTVRGISRSPQGGYNYILDEQNDVAYVRLTQFGDDSLDDLTQALRQVKTQGAKGLILDLRDNGGGLLDSAVGISDLFLDDGQTIVTIRSRIAAEEIYTATDKTLLPDIPLVVLVNWNSASASEIVAGALQDNDRALIVGTRTYGKGSVQQVLAFDEGDGALKLTTAHWYVPSGRLIHRTPDSETWGVDPSAGAYVPMSADDFILWIQRRRDNEADNPFQQLDEPITSQWIEQHLLDPQLAAALQAMQGNLASGHWPQVGRANPDAIAIDLRREGLIQQRDLLQQTLEELDQEIAQLGSDSENSEQTPDIEPEPEPEPELEPEPIGAPE